MLADFLALSASDIIGRSVSFLIDWSPFWLPVLLLYIFWLLWIQYIQAAFIASQEYTVLELKLPKELAKSPLAMEVVLNALHQTSGESNWYAKYIQGKIRGWSAIQCLM